MKTINPEQCAVFFDFDNTIATCDVFDSMLLRFSRNDLWLKLEKEWERGKIGSGACLKGQMKGLKLTKKELGRYLYEIKLDPYFKKIIKLLNKNKTKTVVLSDNFDYILKRILRYHKIPQIKVYSNKLRFLKDKLIPSFPYRSRKCHICGHCKTKNLLANARGESIIIYIGDGRSDICPAQYADVVFAKDQLLKFYKEKKKACFSYDTLKDVYNYFLRAF